MGADTVDEAIAAEMNDDAAALAAFETEHRRILAMQALYLRRVRAGDAA